MIRSGCIGKSQGGAGGVDEWGRVEGVDYKLYLQEIKFES